MTLVSYIDILDYVGDDRQCLIEGEDVFNQNRVEDVQVSCRTNDNVYEVTAVCACQEATAKNSAVSIEISQTETKTLSYKCTCDSHHLRKCHHVAATLIYLHRYPQVTSNSAQQTVTRETEAAISKQSCHEDQPRRQRKVRLKHKSCNDSISPPQSSSKTVITMKTDREVKDLTSDPTWDKENDGDEDEAHDRVSSDEDWKPPKKKRSRHGVPLLPAKDSKGVLDSRKRKKKISKAAVDQIAKKQAAGVKQSDQREYSYLTHKKKIPNVSQLQDHIRDAHTSKQCSRCFRVFRLLKTLRAHEATCNAARKANEKTSSFQTEEMSDDELRMEPLQCLLCEVSTDNRLEMHNHYLLAHDKDSVTVCDRCGEFRLVRDHICPSQLSFRCRMCRMPFKTGRDYWNHLIRASKKHCDGGAPRGPWRCGWARCGENFAAEGEAGLLLHARLHLPAHVHLMCGVCQLVLRTTDAKVVHMQKHDAALYECAACKQACGDKAALRAHWDSHAAERPHLCDACGWRFASEEALQVHVGRFHEGGPFSCAKCPSKFDDRTDVRVHFSAAHGKLRCSAAHCSFRCGNKASLDRHARLAHPSDGDLDPDDPADPVASALVCPACGQAFKQRRELRAHVRDVHRGAGVQCRDCGKAFKSQRDLADHQRLHTGEKPFICAECGMTFKRAQNLEYHTKGAHKNERNFVCPDCGKRFISNADMKRHVRYSHQDGKKWHLCPECGHRLPSLYNLKLHVQSKHTGERPYKCTQCDSGFVTPSDLKKHVMFKHNQEQPFACAQCDKRYQRRRDLDVHVKRHHADTHHACPTCGKDFDSYASMMQHARYHTSEEAFQCAQCGRRFPHRMNLSRHLCLPDIKKNFPCGSCGISFTTSSSLKSHRQRLHAAEVAKAGGPTRATGASERRSAGAGRRPKQQKPPPRANQAPPPQQQPTYMAPPPQQTSLVLEPPHHHVLLEEVHRDHPQQLLEQHQAQHRQAVVVHAARQQSEQGQPVAVEPVAVHHPHEHLHLEQVGVGQPPFEDKLLRGLGSAGSEAEAWALGSVGPAGPAAAAADEAMLSLAGCATYRELEAVQAMAPQPTVLRYEPPAAAAAAAALVVSKSDPPPLIALTAKGDLPHVVYTSASAPAAKLVSVSQSQPQPLASQSPGSAGSAGSQSSLVLGAPIQTTADGSFHLVFVPHGPPTK